MAGTVVAFGLLALAVWGVPGLSSAWATIAIVASAVSLLLLIAFWDWRLSFGAAVGLALIVIAVIRPEFTKHIAG
jgi:multidrug transporter EmrE-like cation transporter